MVGVGVAEAAGVLWRRLEADDDTDEAGEAEDDEDEATGVANRAPVSGDWAAAGDEWRRRPALDDADDDDDDDEEDEEAAGVAMRPATAFSGLLCAATGVPLPRAGDLGAGDLGAGEADAAAELRSMCGWRDQ